MISNDLHLVIRDLSDEMITQNNSKITPDVGFGLQLNRKNSFIGFSSRHLNESSLKIDNVDISYATLKRHYYMVGAYKVQLNEKFNWVPSCLIKHVSGSASQIDFNNHIQYKEQAWIGATYRTNGEFSFQSGLDIGTLLKKIDYSVKVGYSYDVPMASPKLVNISAATHELMLSIIYEVRPKLGKLMENKMIKSPMIF